MCSDLIAQRINRDPFKNPFLDRVRTDPFTGTVFIREGKSWFEHETIEQSIHFMVDRLKMEHNDEVLINTLIVNSQLSAVFPLLRNNYFDDVKKITVNALIEQGLIDPNLGKTVTNSLEQSINDRQTLTTNFLRWLNTIYKHILAKDSNRYSPVLLALLLERSMERYCLEQALLVLESFNACSKTDDLDTADELLKLVAILTSPYRQAVAFAKKQVFGIKEDDDEDDDEKETINRLIKKYKGNISLYDETLVDRFTIPTWRSYPERIREILDWPITLIKDALKQGERNLALPAVQREFVFSSP